MLIVVSLISTYAPAVVSESVKFKVGVVFTITNWDKVLVTPDAFVATKVIENGVEPLATGKQIGPGFCPTYVAGVAPWNDHK